MSTPTGEAGTAPSGRLEIARASKRFGAIAAVDDVTLAVTAGEFVTILGPSGSGKTTLLKIIAGFEIADQGRIGIDGSDITDLDPAARNIGMVFQNYALFPHMTVTRNVGYPLAMRSVPRAEAKVRIEDALRLVELGDYGERLPKQLSGGQQQRVALARAIVFRPRLLLLDEPFGALDRKLREQMQLEVRRLQRQLRLTTIFITHDQEEALIMSDRIAVMDKGRLQQVGLPHEIYETPANPFVADFIGESNILSGTIEAAGDVVRVQLDLGPAVDVGANDGLAVTNNQRVRLMIRPERLVDLEHFTGGPPINRIDGHIIESAYIGVSDKYRLRTPAGLEVLVRLPAGPSRRRYATGEPIAVGFAAGDARLIEVETRR